MTLLWDEGGEKGKSEDLLEAVLSGRHFHGTLCGWVVVVVVVVAMVGGCIS